MYRVSLALFLFSTQVYSTKVFCDGELVSILKDDIIIYASTDCQHCSVYIKEKTSDNPKARLVFKEKNHLLIQKYMRKNKLKLKYCISTQSFEKLLESKATPQMIKF